MENKKWPSQPKEIKKNAGGINVRFSSLRQAGNGPGKHHHDHTNIVFMLEGGCIEKRDRLICERKPADILFLHAGEAHETIFADKPTRYISLDIDPLVLSKNDLTEFQLLNSISKSPDAKFLMLKLYRELLHNDDYTSGSLQMLFLEFAALSKRIRSKNNPPYWVKVVYELLNDRWNEPLSLQELSRVAGVNPITISKHFPSYFACTLGAYMRKLKINKALSIIKSEAIPLTDTAYTCNFFDQSHFTRNFRQLTSFSPKEYQKL
jgi:AraC family transcriptional regulator